MICKRCFLFQFLGLDFLFVYNVLDSQRFYFFIHFLFWGIFCVGLYFLHGAIARIFLVLGSSWLRVRKILVPCKLPSLRKIEDPASIAPLILHSLPYLEDSRSMPPVRCYIFLETRLIDGIFAWKRGCLGNSDHGVQSYSRKKQLNGRNARIVRKKYCSHERTLSYF